MLSSVLKKEAKQLFSDKGFLLLSLIQPVIFIIMFGSSFQGGDINHLHTIVIDLDNTTFSKYVVSAVDKSEFFDIINFSGSFDEAMEKLRQSEVRSIILIPEGFKENIDNTEAGKIKIYLDSSNFLTYSSLSGAQVEIAKDSLLNITDDILGELESEKEDKQKQFDDIKDIFDVVEKDADALDIELKELKEQVGEGGNLDDFSGAIKNLKSEIKSSRNSLVQVQTGLNEMILGLKSMELLNKTDAAKREVITGQLSGLISNFNISIQDSEELLKELNKVDIPEVNTSLSRSIEDRLDRIRFQFETADNKSKEINFDFKKLERKFLSEPIKLEEFAIHGPIRYFDYLGAGVLSLIVFFVGLMAPALNVIAEKEKNTLYRLSTTPVSSITFFVGKFIVFMGFGIIEMIYTLFLAIVLYDLRISGSIYAVIFILSLLACASISIGLLISSKVKTMQQALVFVPLIVIPSFLISHAFFPPDIMTSYMNYVAYITPMTFSNHALNAIMVKGFSLGEVMPDIYALLGFTIIPLILFIWSFKRIKY